MPTQRYKMIVSYRGTAYHGWQFQVATRTWKGPLPPAGQGIPTVQQALKRAVTIVLRHPITLVGSSRTDAGVHAKGQVVHFDTHLTQVPPEGMRRAINHQLPDDIIIRDIEPVPDSFDAIASTSRKRYQYFIWNSEDRPVFFADLAWHRWQPLNIDAMKRAAQVLVGEHDFASFARPGHGRDNTIRIVHECSVSWRAPKLVIGVEGGGFLWQMVRIIVGTLVQVGLGTYDADRVRQMLQAKDRRAAGPTAPPHGLYLQWVQTQCKNEPERSTLDV